MRNNIDIKISNDIIGMKIKMEINSSDFLKQERNYMLDIGNIIKSTTKELMCKEELNDFINILGEKISKMDEIEYTIDRFEGKYAVCENRDTREMINVEKEKLPNGVIEGSILKLKNGEFSIDEESQEKIEERIKEKMDKLWNN